MKQAMLFLFLLPAINILGTTSSSESSSDSTIKVTLPSIHIQNRSDSDTKLESFTVSYSFLESEKSGKKEVVDTISLPAKKITVIKSSMQPPKTKTPEFEGISEIKVDGQVLKVRNHLFALSPNKPIAINKDKNNQWQIMYDINSTENLNNIYHPSTT